MTDNYHKPYINLGMWVVKIKRDNAGVVCQNIFSLNPNNHDPFGDG